ncbi:katanin p60 ATPase-containing subunit A-like 2 [Portunus trituberculatus]|uniref:katanin p60 ATPase-containing subunit A-like 2 n=1 Tax=Portunus trituberculatus TaxID=210409 RepID=UPI001E1D133D|nr:katanin p60 ATPase-containing subunit A-like 2 [Portunus trituberculatus]
MATNAHLSLQSLRAASQAKDLADKRAEIRRKSLLILVHHYLDNEGFNDAAKLLAQESRLNTEQFSVCEKVDLSGILEDYENWFVNKFQKYPRLARRVIVPRTPPKPHRCDLHGHGGDENSLGNETPSGKKTPFFRRRSLPRSGGSGHSMGRTASDPSLNEDGVEVRGHARSRNSVRNKSVDNKKREELNRGPLVGGRRMSSSGPVRSSGDEKKDPSKSSSDTDSERGGAAGHLGPVRTGRMAGQPRQVINLKQMISDYTRLEDNIGDIGKGPPRAPSSQAEQQAGEEEEGSDLWDEKSVKPTIMLPHFSGEFRDLANIIQREILVENPQVRWSEILGLEDAKRLVKEAVVYPLKYPQLFIGRFKPWRGILLYGPPGTGKTLLAKAVATECKTTFFNISATSLVSKWRGDSEKLVRVLFEMARFHAPSTIFVDEVDALMASRQGEQEHEASRRMKTQLLVELDGLTQSNHHVFLLAASNIPWQLDPAMLRRLEKRILVPLPGKEAREAMFRHHLPESITDLEEVGHTISTHLEYDKLAKISEGYSGSDLQVACREASMGCLRKVFNVLEDHSVEDSELPELKLDAIKMHDVEAALQKTKPTQSDSQLYLEWHSKYGSA